MIEAVERIVLGRITAPPKIDSITILSIIDQQSQSPQLEPSLMLFSRNLVVRG